MQQEWKTTLYPTLIFFLKIRFVGFFPVIDNDKMFSPFKVKVACNTAVTARELICVFIKNVWVNSCIFIKFPLDIEGRMKANLNLMNISQIQWYYVSRLP